MIKNNRNEKTSVNNYVESSGNNIQKINNSFKNNNNYLRETSLNFDHIFSQTTLFNNPGKFNKNYIFEKVFQNSLYNNYFNSYLYSLYNKDEISKSYIIKLYTHLSFLLKSDSLLIKPPKSEKIYYEYAFSLIENNLSDGFDDIESAVITIKQLIILLTHCTHINMFNRLYDSQTANSYIYAYYCLFETFMNRVQWENLFPSMPETARELNLRKIELLKLILEQKDYFRIDKFSEKIITKLSLYSKLDIYFISFLDFSIFTWLSYFGIIKYLTGKDNEPVKVKITQHGRLFLQSFISY